MSIQLKYIQDPGHGWMELPQAWCDTLHIASRISRYSYKHEHYVYLEEDCDMALAMNAFAARGIEVDLIEEYQDPTPIRGYASYLAPRPVSAYAP